jgi:hypothetical protein
MPGQMIVVSSENDSPIGRRIWGTGGWIPPEQREALDWSTLSRIHGWGVMIYSQPDSGLGHFLSKQTRWIVISCDPDSLGEDFVSLLALYLETAPVLVLARAGIPNGNFHRLTGASRCSNDITGNTLSWVGPGPTRRWLCRNPVGASSLDFLEGSEIWATLNGMPLILARRFGRGVVATMACHPSEARDNDGGISALVKHFLIWGAQAPVAWFDHEGSFILRMDDPGSAESVHHRRYSFPKLGISEWDSIGKDLKRRDARMTIGYVSGWVDDGDTKRGTLSVGGKLVPRFPGRVYPSPLVKYRFFGGNESGSLFDYEAEYFGIQALRTAGLAEVELHGHTHMHPDGLFWAAAPDRYDSDDWYREFGPQAREVIASRPPKNHPVALGIDALQRYFGVHPSTLICPGDQWGNDVLERALDSDLGLVSSYYLALRNGNRFFWTQHVCAPYLEDPNGSWFDAELPVIACFHDFDLGRKGMEWFSRLLDRWQDAGAKRLIDLRELATMVSRRLSLEDREGGITLVVEGDNAPEPVRPLSILIRMEHGRVPKEITVSHGKKIAVEKVQDLGNGIGRISLKGDNEWRVS